MQQCRFCPLQNLCKRLNYGAKTVLGLSITFTSPKSLCIYTHNRKQARDKVKALDNLFQWTTIVPLLQIKYHLSLVLAEFYPGIKTAISHQSNDRKFSDLDHRLADIVFVLGHQRNHMT